LEAVGAGDAGGLVGEAGFVEGAVEEIAGAIAGEDAAGAVSAVGTGARPMMRRRALGSPKRDGFAPVVLVEIGATADAADFFAVGD